MLYNNTGRDALAPLNIVTNPDLDYFVKLIDVTTGENAMGIFVRGGSVAEFEVPLGSYEVRYASGLTWYGLGDLFGPETSYAKAAETFAFTEDADGYVGYTSHPDYAGRRQPRHAGHRAGVVLRPLIPRPSRSAAGTNSPCPRGNRSRCPATPR